MCRPTSSSRSMTLTSSSSKGQLYRYDVMPCTRLAAAPAMATTPRHPTTHTGSTARHTNAQTARTRVTRTKLAPASALLSSTNALSSSCSCTTFCHQMPCNHATRTQHSTTSLHLLDPDANPARTLRSALHICTLNSPVIAIELSTFCCHALPLLGRSSKDRSVPAI